MNGDAKRQIPIATSADNHPDRGASSKSSKKKLKDVDCSAIQLSFQSNFFQQDKIWDKHLFDIAIVRVKCNVIEDNVSMLCIFI